jgi:hypothetical protein
MARRSSPSRTPALWSRYSVGGPDSTLDQHKLVTDVLGTLCRRQGTAVYCDHAARYEAYLEQRAG